MDLVREFMEKWGGQFEKLLRQVGEEQENVVESFLNRWQAQHQRANRAEAELAVAREQLVECERMWREAEKLLMRGFSQLDNDSQIHSDVMAYFEVKPAAVTLSDESELRPEHRRRRCKPWCGRSYQDEGVPLLMLARGEPPYPSYFCWTIGPAPAVVWCSENCLNARFPPMLQPGEEEGS